MATLVKDLMRDIEQIEGFIQDTKDHLNAAIEIAKANNAPSVTMSGLMEARDSTIAYYLEERDKRHKQVVMFNESNVTGV